MMSCEVESTNDQKKPDNVNTILNESEYVTEGNTHPEETQASETEEATTADKSEGTLNGETETVEGEQDAESEPAIEQNTENGAESEEITEEETEEYVSPYLAPDFTVYDLDGNEVKLSDYRGRPIVLNFWARDCIYCTMEMADFQSAYEKYGDEVEFLMVCFTSFSGKGIEYEQEYITDNGYTFPVYFDTKNSAVSKYGINSIPQTFFINRDFDLYTYIPGMASAESLEACIGYILE